jgi:5-methylcytosine-specific restriction enzyme A
MIGYPLPSNSMATGMPVSNFYAGWQAGNVNRYVRDLGFTVVELRRRNPTWVRDELILALDMYLRYAGNPPRKGSSQIDELSETLNRLGRYLGIATEDRFRNVNGVYMKLMNFRRFDPLFTEAGKRGLSRGGQAEEEVWNTFASDPERCHAVAQTIRQALAHAQNGETIADLAGDGIEEAVEGRVITALHRRYERNSALVQAKKKKALATLGRLACETCGFDFRERYGDHGEGFIECHHTKPVHALKPGDKTKAGDLRLLCSNCHRMVHAKRPWLTMEELVAVLRGQRDRPSQ